MPNFPKINEKFYAAGRRLPSIRAAIEQCAELDAEMERMAESFPAEPLKMTREDFESKTFSLVLGALDGLLKRQ